MAQNQLTLRLSDVNALPERPRVLSTDSALHYSSHTVVVKLLCNTVAELPDFQANLASLRELEDRLSAGWPQVPNRFTEELLSWGQAHVIESGYVLPVSVPYGCDNRYAALALDRRIGTGSDKLFSATLCVLYATSPPAVGEVVDRQVSVNDQSPSVTCGVPIAQIVG